MARQGSLTGAHRILTARGDTLRADAIPALAAALERDPWSAWEEAEEPPPQPAPPPAPKAADVFSLGVEESTALQELPNHAIMPVAPLSPPPTAPAQTSFATIRDAPHLFVCLCSLVDSDPTARSALRIREAGKSIACTGKPGPNQRTCAICPSV
jgi:hypothetical protein